MTTVHRIPNDLAVEIEKLRRKLEQKHGDRIGFPEAMRRYMDGER